MTDNVLPLQNPGANDTEVSPLDAIVREGARRLLQAALDNEVAEVIARFSNVVDDAGRRVVVRNGHLPERELVTGAGPLKVKQPRVRDRSGELKFTSKILPPFLRRTPSVDALIPVLYLKGISTGDCSEALEAILGPNASGPSAGNIVRLKEGWEAEYDEWSKRDLSQRRYVSRRKRSALTPKSLDKIRMCFLLSSRSRRSNFLPS